MDTFIPRFIFTALGFCVLGLGVWCVINSPNTPLHQLAAALLTLYGLLTAGAACTIGD